MSQNNKRTENRTGRTKRAAQLKADATSKARALYNAKPQSPPVKRDNTKLSVIIAMLRQPKGATIDVIAKSVGWQQHSVRGVIAGTVKKKLGLMVTSAKTETGRIYRITGNRAA